MPRVYNKHHGATPPSAVYVGRPSEWGNPFSHLSSTIAKFRVSSRDEAILRYRRWLIDRMDVEPGLLTRIRSELGGKDLVCWCAPHACHADVLMQIANSTNQPSQFKSYAGIGSRRTPQEILDSMRKIAGYLAGKGYTLRSGAAIGADSAFEEGALAAGGDAEVWVPWAGFNGHSSSQTPSPEAFALAAKSHPAWDSCKNGAKALHARNVHQLLGADLESPVDFIVCWTRDGLMAGGTGQSLRIAKNKGIEVYNLGVAGELVRLREKFKAPPVSHP